MKIEDQVCSLELSKRLKELGVKQESLIHWLNIQHCVHAKVKDNGWEVETDNNGNVIIDKIDYRIELGNRFAYNIDKDNFWCAFTVAELGELLKNPTPNIILTYKINDLYKCATGCEDTILVEFEEENEADARAKMLIYLLENKLMEL